ncbi:MAG: hypothetical protein Q8R02_03705 [Hyphomonadaceae bacterium]|nr:hypothetical protein [Hyphomonadaceae bacterium]
MGKLREEITASLPSGLRLPDEFAAAIDWIDACGAVGRTTHGGTSFGMLDREFLRSRGGSCIAFEPLDPQHASLWTGCKNPKETDRLAPIVRTGGDGSYAALWLDDTGAQQIVHMGSGSGSMMTGIMVETPLDFLRLLAIGYEELCWPEVLNLPPHEAAMNPDLLEPPTQFREWVVSTYGVTIPQTAMEIMLPPANMDQPSDDPFCVWMDRIRG